MALRCFLFSSDEETAANLRQILASLDVEGEFCADAVTAAERITNQLFQIVIIDWDQQPEAGLLLTTARERKAAERPLTLAVVSNDGDAPRALHAGANSLLRKPIIVNQARETLTTARDLLRSKQGAAANATSSASASSSLAVFPVIADTATPQAGEFLPTPRLAPGGLLETEPTIPQTLDEARHAAATLRDLDPSAASVAEEEAAPPAAPKHSGTRGLEWYLKTRGAAQPSAGSAAAPAPAPLAVSSTRGNPELLGSDQISSYSPSPEPAASPSLDSRKVKAAPAVESTLRERKNEAELFAYMQGGKKSP